MAGLIGRLLKNRRAGHDKLSWNRPDLQGPETIHLTSSSFDHRAHMPIWTAGKVSAKTGPRSLSGLEFR